MLTREQKVEKMVDWDIADIYDSLLKDDASFLSAVLSGEGWIPYNQLTDEQVDSEYISREFEENE